MTPEGFQLYLTRLKEIRETLTDPKRIKFIDDIFEGLRYKDSIISENHKEFYRIIQKTLKEVEDVRYKLEGCALRYGIPGWEIEKWLRMNPDQVVREVKFWQEFNDIKPEPIVPPRIAKKPLLNWKDGLPSVPFKSQFSLKNILNEK